MLPWGLTQARSLDILKIPSYNDSQYRSVPIFFLFLFWLFNGMILILYLCSESGGLDYLKSLICRAGIGHGGGSVICSQDTNCGAKEGRYERPRLGAKSGMRQTDRKSYSSHWGEW